MCHAWLNLTQDLVEGGEKKKRLGNEESLRKRKEMTHSETKTREEKKKGKACKETQFKRDQRVIYF